jgi:hypothetical protein
MDESMAAHHMPPVACGHGNIWLVYARLQEGKDVSQRMDACLLTHCLRQKEIKDSRLSGIRKVTRQAGPTLAVRTGIETGNGRPSGWNLPPGKFIYARFIQDYGAVPCSRPRCHSGAVRFGFHED